MASKKTACSLIFLLGALSTRAATINVACDFLAISNACNVTAVEGDTVLIAAGSCIMTNTLSIDRNISFWIQGSGTNQTFLTSANGLSKTIEVLSCSANLFSISDMTLVDNGGNNSGWIVIGAGQGTRFMAGSTRIYNIRMTNLIGRAIEFGKSDARGLIDHCFFDTSPNNAQTFQGISFEGNYFLSWSNSLPYGTTNAVYVEDCYFRNTNYATRSGGNGFWDGYDGAQAVLRHNVFDGPANNGTHGYDSALVSARSQECYQNVFTNQTLSSGLDVDAIRGGGLMIYSNNIYLNDTTAFSSNSVWIGLQYYRATCWEVYPANSFASGYPGVCYTNQVYTFTNIDGVNFQRTVPQPGGVWTSTNSIMTDGGSTLFGLWYPFTMKNDISGNGDYVKLGASLAATLTNMYLLLTATGSGPYDDTVGAGSTGYGTAFNIHAHRNHDFYAIAQTTNSITVVGAMDGTGSFKYPGAMQPGTITCTPYTNTGVTIFPCYAWSNVVYGSNGAIIGIQNFIRSWEQPGNCNTTSDAVTNLMVAGRDFSNAVPSSATYTALVYPHPLIPIATISSRSGPGRSRKPR